MEDRGELMTEMSNERSLNLDQLSTSELVRLFSEEDIQPQLAVAKAIPEIIKTIDLILPRMKNGGNLFYLGTGTSGRLGVLDASECPPTFCSPPDLIQGVIAGGSAALTTSSEGLEDLEYLSIEDLNSRNFSSNDCLIGITAGGTTAYVKSALSHAIRIGALSIAIASVPAEQARLECDVDIRLITGPELLSGSTRLKAATATKMTLNMISTILMVKLGKVYGNKMIDVAVKNSKLMDRALRILADLADINRKEGAELLEISNGSVKLSLLMALGNLDIDNAQNILKANNYSLREALNVIDYPSK
ncbi:N-acetylmuramic acid 6-phosphate etherase [Prochlorococcus sp. MIT 1307]|uniref:N-acetylmuramic acid 6-phosphate etherase n=1 Tax=Prochlorococcus sp. MIT 1307 TaxID=3096219 RepID=UPI002A747DE9|nr:N-acetylmuramic acid 6-phosphate etherase [Prochlorococcus sp. MIT 1307]